MKGRQRRTQRQLMVIILAVLALGVAGLQARLQPSEAPMAPSRQPVPPRTRAQRPTPAPQPRTTPAPAPTRTPASVVAAQIIRNEAGRVIYEGDMDLAPTLARIAAGTRDAHETDGDYFRNHEQRLPIKRDRNYYRKYVVRTPGYGGTGPQRLVLGAGGELYYTPDHYETFRKLPLALPN